MNAGITRLQSVAAHLQDQHDAALADMRAMDPMDDKEAASEVLERLAHWQVVARAAVRVVSLANNGFASITTREQAESVVRDLVAVAWQMAQVDQADTVRLMLQLTAHERLTELFGGEEQRDGVVRSWIHGDMWEGLSGD